MKELKIFYKQMRNRNEEERSKVIIKSVSLFVVERFHQLIQIKSILVFYDF